MNYIKRDSIVVSLSLSLKERKDERELSGQSKKHLEKRKDEREFN